MSSGDLRHRAMQRAIQSEKNIETRISYRTAGHGFSFWEGDIRCVGCGLGARADWKGEYLYQAAAQKLVKEHGDCGKPFDLQKRIAEIEAQYAPKPQTQTGKKGKEVTLETINAKLDKIMEALRIF